MATLAEILCEEGLLPQREAEGALAAAEEIGVPLVTVLLEQGLVRGAELRDMLRRRLSLPEFDPEATTVDQDAVRLVPLEEARRYRIIPVRLEVSGAERELTLAMVDPTDTHAQDNVAFTTGAVVRPLLALDTHLDAAIHATYQGIVTRVMSRHPSPDTDPDAPAKFDPGRERFGGELNPGRLETKPMSRPGEQGERDLEAISWRAMLTLLIRKGLVSREEFEREVERQKSGDLDAPESSSEGR